jgi:hypothetical protein
VRMNGECKIFQIRTHFHRQHSLGQQRRTPPRFEAGLADRRQDC